MILWDIDNGTNGGFIGYSWDILSGHQAWLQNAPYLVHVLFPIENPIYIYIYRYIYIYSIYRVYIYIYRIFMDFPACHV